MILNHRYAGALLAAACAAGSFAVQAADAQPAMRVAKDPVTGELRAMTPTESAHAATAVRSDAAQRGLRTGRLNPQAIRHANGAVEQELTEDSLMVSVARRNADGTVGWVCVPAAKAAAVVADDKSDISLQEHDHDR